MEKTTAVPFATAVPRASVASAIVPVTLCPNVGTVSEWMNTGWQQQLPTVPGDNGIGIFEKKI
jgi:hypothetical protein